MTERRRVVPPTEPESRPVAEAASGGRCVVRVDLPRKILHVTITGALTLEQGLAYRREMLAAFPRLARVRPWGVLSDRRLARVQSDEVQAIMAEVFELATQAGRTRAAVIASSAITRLQMQRLARDARVVQRQFLEEAPAASWLQEELA